MTAARALVLAALCAAGCRAAPTTVRVSLSAGLGLSADQITLTVFDRNGRVVDNAELGGADRLPGDVVVMVSAGAGEARAVAVASSGGVAVGEAAGRVPVLPRQEMPLGLQLVVGAMPDSDHDGVPDVVDNCPTTANADQISSSGDNTGDACRVSGGGDGGVINPDPGGVDMSGGGGDGGVVVPPGCGNGVVESGEECDQGAANSDDPASASTCTTMCKKRAACGSVSGAAAAKIDPATGHCYVAWPGPINFASAQRDCQSRGGYLAVVTSSAENSIVNAVSGLSQMWIGLEITHAATDSFRWVDGEPFLYSAFATGEPNNGANNGGRAEDCGARTILGWADLPCGFPSTGNLPASPTFALGFVCESSCGN
ncbi:MAG: lectin-like protein, partial [Polyangia bacterium]